MMLSSALAVQSLPLGTFAILIHSSVVFTPLIAICVQKEPLTAWKVLFVLILIVGDLIVVQPHFLFEVRRWLFATDINSIYFVILVISRTEPRTRTRFLTLLSSVTWRL